MVYTEQYFKQHGFVLTFKRLDKDLVGFAIIVVLKPVHLEIISSLNHHIKLEIHT